MEDLMLAIIFAVMFVVIGIFAYGVHKAEDLHFDERQMAARGKAYKSGFIAMIVALIAYFLYDDLFPKSLIRLEASLVVFITLILGLTVFISIAIWHDAYTYAEKEQHNLGFGITYILMAVLCVFVVKTGFPSNVKFIENGEVVYQRAYTQLGMLVVYGVIGGAFVAKAIANRFDREDEE